MKETRWAVDVTKHLRFIRYLTRRFEVDGYERDDFQQDICLLAASAPNADRAPGQDRSYLVRAARFSRRSYLRKMNANKRRVVVSIDDFGLLLERTPCQGGQFERQLLREALTELANPKPWEGAGNTRRKESAQQMVVAAITGDPQGSRTEGQARRTAIYELRKHLRDQFSMTGTGDHRQ